MIIFPYVVTKIVNALISVESNTNISTSLLIKPEKLSKEELVKRACSSASFLSRNIGISESSIKQDNNNLRFGLNSGEVGWRRIQNAILAEDAHRLAGEVAIHRGNSFKSFSQFCGFCFRGGGWDCGEGLMTTIWFQGWEKQGSRR